MDGFKAGDPRRCCFHPIEVVVGVCALCLKERLAALASKHGKLSLPRKKLCISVPKVSALSSFLNRAKLRRMKQLDDAEEADFNSSLEDSFITMKLEANGQATWDKKSPISTKLSDFLQNLESDFKEEAKTPADCANPRGGSGSDSRWRKRVGQLFQSTHWKRPGNGSSPQMCEVGGVVVKGRRGWARELARRTTW